MEKRMQSPIGVTQALFERFGEGDIPGILRLLGDDIVVDFYGPPVIPYAGHYEGLDEARVFFETVLASVDIHVFEPEQFFGDGPMVAVTGKLHLTARSTGRDIRSDFAHVIEVRDGRWRRFRDFMNTAEAAAAFGPLAASCGSPADAPGASPPNLAP
jgi:ketosteroid isomerase-like protein